MLLFSSSIQIFSFVQDFEGLNKFILVAEPVEFHSAGSSAPSISASSFLSDSVDDGTFISNGFDENASFDEVSENSSEFSGFIDFSDYYEGFNVCPEAIRVITRPIL